MAHAPVRWGKVAAPYAAELCLRPGVTVTRSSVPDRPTTIPPAGVSHVLVQPPDGRRQVGPQPETTAPRLSQRGAVAGASGRFRCGADVVPAGDARSSQRSAHPPEHGDRVLAHR